MPTKRKPTKQPSDPGRFINGNINKADAIRQLLQSGMREPSEIVAALAKRKITITPHAVHHIVSSERKRGNDYGKPAGKEINKSAIIRELIKSGLKTVPDIKAALAKRKIECNSSLISQQLHPATEKARQQKRTKRAARIAAKAGGDVTARRAALDKSAAIRELMASGVKAPTDIVAALAKRGMEVSPVTVYRVIGYDRRGGAEGKQRRAKAVAHVGTNGEAPKSELDRAFEVAKEFGGVRNLQAVLKRLRKLVR